MMLEHLGETEAAGRLMRAIEHVVAAGTLTPDLGGSQSTADVTQAVVEQLATAADNA
jgi:tartrate dehydrogenase/decarboxylase / D-malate dehydrogenase